MRKLGHLTRQLGRDYLILSDTPGTEPFDTFELIVFKAAGKPVNGTNIEFLRGDYSKNGWSRLASWPTANA